MVLCITGIAVAILLVSIQLVLLYLIGHELKWAKKAILDDVKKVGHTRQG
jgi:hypothetical protein